ncbi:oligosaccharide flippase family protein [Rhodopseudomonas sp. G2_2311]|uniref:oligosaccharide flippase family protein n=1 Tax=Rhodopseudomonas sp. G2_2311 TaxID=3114287 RepID=UPI0039C71AD7
MIKNSLVNGLGLTFPIVAAILCIPPIFAILGEENSGLLLLIWAIVNSSALLDFGLGRALTLYLAKADSNADVSSIIGVAFWLSALIGAVFGMALYFGSTALAAHLGKASAGPAFQAIAWSAPFIIVTSILRGVLEANRQFVIVNAIRIPTGTLNFVGPLLVVWFLQPDNALVAWSLTLGRVLTFLLFFLFACRNSTGSVWRVRNLNGSLSLISSGGWMTISNMAGPVLNLVERFVIGSQLSFSVVTVYATPQEFVSRLAIIPNAISITLFPELANNRLDEASLSRIYINCLGVILVLIAAPTLAIVLFAHEILSIWLGVQFALSSSATLQVFAIGGLAGALAQIPFVLIQARGGARFTGSLHLIEMTLFSLALIIAVSNWGLIGALVTWLIRCILDAIILFLYASRFAKLRLHRDSVARLALLAVTLACLPLMWVDSSWPRLAALVFVTGLSARSAAAIFRSGIGGRT